ncbi:MAG: TonB-dependent receptor [Dechloromonas sp.]|nr:TonB-dependent receptor [Dechloromonas sp.]
MKRQIFPLAAFGLVSLAQAESAVLKMEAVEVIGNSPLAGLGIPRQQVPANVQTISAAQLEGQESLNVAEFMARQLPSVHLNEVQGNPFQADLNYRGFTASPLLGTAQGLSVYLDGVRVNEPFGDTVNWELLPHSAIAGMDLMPGSNPVFGLNTLGGALAIRTRDGFSSPGTQLELSGGSFGRFRQEFSHGGHTDQLGWFVAADGFQEAGWRERSPSASGQLFGKWSYRSAVAEADFSLLHAQSKMTGNGLLPQSMQAAQRNQVFTHPDQTRHDLTQWTLNARWWLDPAQSLSANIYQRFNDTRTLNGDANDDFEDGPFDGVSDQASGAHNRTRTRQRGQGMAWQWNLSTKRHQLTVGGGYDEARVSFRQTQALGVLDASRGISQLAAEADQNLLHGRTTTASLFVTDTVALTPQWHLTASARYNHSRVTTQDQLNPNPPNLDGDHRYRQLNPALGLTWQAQPGLNFYGGFSQGNRVPTPIELGCADPANPCTLPNAMAADPYLKQVVARTLEAGVRGRLSEQLAWQAGVYRTLSRDDILFVGTSTSAGYFTNFGQTRRQGVELGLNGRQRQVDWFVNYSYLQATFQSSACLLAQNNSSRGSDAACTVNGQDDEILVRAGDRLPGQPAHSLKLGVNWPVGEGWRLGADVQAFSNQFARGNENNQHQAGSATDTFGTVRQFEGAGRLPGYAILNLNAEVRLGQGWQLFAQVNNLFDTRYSTAGALAENPFNAAGAFQVDSADWRRETFVAPGAPRAIWLGVRHVFGGRS